MKPAVTSTTSKTPIKQKYLDVFMSPPCEFLLTPQQHEISVLNLVQNGGAPYICLPDSYFVKAVKPESKTTQYWKEIINKVLASPKSQLKKYTGWKQQQADLDKLMQEVKL